MEAEKNACLPTAISMKEGLRRQGISSHVVVYSFFDQTKNRLAGHAITSYLYPPGKNQMWTYDYRGSIRTRAFFDDAYGTAQAAEIARGKSDIKIFTAEFIE